MTNGSDGRSALPQPERRGKRRKRRFVDRQRPVVPGIAPGTIVVDPDSPRPVLSVMAFGPPAHAEEHNTTLERIQELAKTFSVVWVNVDGLGDAAVIEQIGRAFELHPLALEDVVNVHQRAKVEPYDGADFLALRIVEKVNPLATEQISLFLKKKVLVTFQERAGDCFDGVRARIRQKGGRVRDLGADYLMYTLLDAMVDTFFPALEHLGERLERLEDEVLAETRGLRLLQHIHDVRRELLTLRRAAWPLRDMMSALLREERALIAPETRVFLRDCYDHVVQIIDMIETYREVVTGLVDVHFSQTSNRLNDVMRVLTVISSIFIPLSFIAGVYGMNFDPEASSWNMPELRWVYGYPFAIGLMASVGLGFFTFFYRRGWIGSRDLDLREPRQPRDNGDEL
jgi:magnesium transporter